MLDRSSSGWARHPALQSRCRSPLLPAALPVASATQKPATSRSGASSRDGWPYGAGVEPGGEDALQPPCLGSGVVKMRCQPSSSVDRPALTPDANHGQVLPHHPLGRTSTLRAGALAGVRTLAPGSPIGSRAPPASDHAERLTRRRFRCSSAGGVALIVRRRGERIGKPATKRAQLVAATGFHPLPPHPVPTGCGG
jgi:hypothetical protein